MQERRLVESFNAAIEGIIYVIKNERNMRFHFLAAFILLILGVYLNFDSTEFLMLTLTITLVLTTEIINTALEHLVDVVKSEFHPVARVIKDAGAGAVLLASINAVIVGYMLFARRIPFSIDIAMSRIRQSPWHITFIALIVVFGASIMGKVFFHKGKPLRGGMPSGHAAIAFSIVTVMAFIANNAIVTTLAFVMALLIARHRVTYAIHTLWEVVAGALLGTLLTTLVFQIFR